MHDLGALFTYKKGAAACEAHDRFSGIDLSYLLKKDAISSAPDKEYPDEYR